MTTKKKAPQLQASSIDIMEIKIIEGHVESNEDFDDRLIAAFDSDCSLRFFTGAEREGLRGELKIWVETQSDPPQVEAHGHFHFQFLFLIKDLQTWLPEGPNGELSIASSLQNAIAAVSYSTARGILIGRFHGTAFHRFILPVINPADLLDTPKKAGKQSRG